jgi:hypothetical protein
MGSRKKHSLNSKRTVGVTKVNPGPDVVAEMPQQVDFSVTVFWDGPSLR